VSVQRVMTPAGRVRFRARVKFHGREVATKYFDRRADAVAWANDQSRHLRIGDWVDPRRGRVSLTVVAEGWLVSRASVKRRTRETDEAAWANYVEPSFGNRAIGSITTAEVTEWLANLLASGLAPSTARRALAVIRGILDHAVADERLSRNVARAVRPPRSTGVREGIALTIDEVEALATACHGPLSDVVLILGYTGLRWGELAGLQVGDRVDIPGPGMRVRRAVLTAADGTAFVDSAKNHRARTVPLPHRVAEVVRARCEGRSAGAWLFETSVGTPLREENWKRAVRWSQAKQTVGRPGLRVHDLRHSAASIWWGAGVDAKVVQQVLGHATASMTLDLYGHVIDANLWRGADLIGGQIGAVDLDKLAGQHSTGLLEGPSSGPSGVEPPEGVEPSTYALRVRRSGRLS
jgi:integrase